MIDIRGKSLSEVLDVTAKLLDGFVEQVMADSEAELRALGATDIEVEDLMRSQRRELDRQKVLALGEISRGLSSGSKELN